MKRWVRFFLPRKLCVYFYNFWGNRETVRKDWHDAVSRHHYLTTTHTLHFALLIDTYIRLCYMYFSGKRIFSKSLSRAYSAFSIHFAFLVIITTYLLKMDGFSEPIGSQPFGCQVEDTSLSCHCHLDTSRGSYSYLSEECFLIWSLFVCLWKLCILVSRYDVIYKRKTTYIGSINKKY